jgi:hypothetical protein
VAQLTGCAAIGGAAASGFTDGLTAALLDQEDPELVREATPAFLMMLDAVVRNDPQNARALGAAAQLYSAYGVMFVTDDERSETLTARARQYGARAICAAERATCGLDEAEIDRFKEIVDRVGDRDAEALYSYCVGSLAFIRAHSEDWTAIAALPKVEYALQHLLQLDTARRGSVHLYLGILSTLRPEALGGKPEQGREHFEYALQFSDVRDLSVKVEYARSYARLVYDRELHDRLLGEVLQAPVRAEGLTLFNTLAQRDARELLAGADEYF